MEEEKELLLKYLDGQPVRYDENSLVADVIVCYKLGILPRRGGFRDQSTSFQNLFLFFVEVTENRVRTFYQDRYIQDRYIENDNRTLN